MNDDADATMSRADALAELRRRYRVRFLVEVEHEGKSYAARGTTIARLPEEVETAAVELLRVMLGRAMEQLGPVPAERGH
jgi:hypothetical protein